MINVKASPQTTLDQAQKTAMLAELESETTPSTVRPVELAEIIQRESLSEGVKEDMNIYIGNVLDPHFTGEKPRRELANTLYGIVMKQEPSAVQSGGRIMKKKSKKSKKSRSQKQLRNNRKTRKVKRRVE